MKERIRRIAYRSICYALLIASTYFLFGPIAVSPDMTAEQILNAYWPSYVFGCICTLMYLWLEAHPTK